MTGCLEICCDVLIGQKGGRGRNGKRKGERERRREERQSENYNVLITFHIETMWYLWVCYSAPFIWCFYDKNLIIKYF